MHVSAMRPLRRSVPSALPISYMNNFVCVRVCGCYVAPLLSSSRRAQALSKRAPYLATPPRSLLRAQLVASHSLTSAHAA